MSIDALPAPSSAEPALDLTGGLPQAVRGAALVQFDRIAGGIDPGIQDPDEGVHVARKAMKRQRALLRLVRDEVGFPAYRQENVVLRDVARLLSPVRDGYVLIQTLDGLRDQYGAVLADDAFATTRRCLERRYRAARAVLEDRALMVHVRVTLATARSRMMRWNPAAAEPPARRLAAGGVRNDFAAIAPGLRRVYRRGRRRMERAYRDGTEASFHDWRKRVKYLRYQMEALEPIWPEMLAAHGGRLDQLGDMLGVCHDLAVLETIVRDDDTATADQRERTLLLALIHRSRLETQWEARPLGRSLYAEKPNEFVARIGAYYDAARMG